MTLRDVGIACVGAGAMYLLDPEVGRRRRALIRDQYVRWRGESLDAFRVAARDLSNRAAGVVAETRGFLEDKMPALGAGTAARRGRLTPATRALIGSVTGGLVLATASRYAILGPLVASAALGSLAAAVANVERGRLRSAAESRHAAHDPAASA